jgi:nucleotide-binding universal stress UspA family protein
VVQGIAIAKAFGIGVMIVKATPMWSLETLTGDTDSPARIRQYDEEAARVAEGVLKAAAAKADAAGVACETVHARNREPAEAYIEVAKTQGCDLIAMGTHARRGLDRFLLGSQADEVMTHAGISVLICQ